MMNSGKLTFEELLVFVGLEVNLCELSNSDLLWDCSLDSRGGVVSISPVSNSPWLVLLLSKGDSDRDGEDGHIRGAWHWEVVW